MRPMGTATESEQRRRKAIELLEAGHTPTQVAEAWEWRVRVYSDGKRRCGMAANER